MYHREYKNTMNKTMDKYVGIKINKWKWIINDPNLLHPWFDNFLQYTTGENCIKSNKQRTVFKVLVNEIWYYVKFLHPSSFLDTQRGLLMKSKAELEFNSGNLLKSVGIPVVDMIGWGKCGSKSMLITKEAYGTINARTHWLTQAANTVDQRETFLLALSEIVNKFRINNIIHPDFHLGNILLKIERNGNNNFIIVDPYGISSKKNYVNSKDSGVWMLLGFFKYELTKDERNYLLINCGLTVSLETSKKLWNKIILHDAESNNSKWDKRKAKVLSGKSRFCKSFVDSVKTIGFIRKSLITGETVVPIEDIKLILDNTKDYKIIKLDHKSATRLWLFSFFLQFHSIDHYNPLIWVHGDIDLLIFKNDNKIVSLNGDEDLKIDLIYKCEISGIKITDCNKQILFVDKKPKLDCLRAELYNKNKFDQ